MVGENSEEVSNNQTTDECLERTLALIKPDACGKPWFEVIKVRREDDEEEEDEADEDAPPKDPWMDQKQLRAPDKATEILKRIEQEGFKIVKQRTLCLSLDDARAFYAEHVGKPFFGKLTQFMSSGPIIALILEKENAIKSWRALMGPTNTQKAYEASENIHPLNDEKWTLRALFGTDGTRNATHGSDSAFSAMREMAFFFPEQGTFQRSVLTLSPKLAQDEVKSKQILQELEQNNYWIVADKEFDLEKSQIDLLTQHENSDLSTYSIDGLKQGKARLLIVERHDAITKLLLVVGPPTVEQAKDSMPDSFRARFYQDTDVSLFAAGKEEQVEQIIEQIFGGELAFPMEYTLALIKPGTADKFYRPIMREILSHKFSILAEKRLTLEMEEAENFYAEHKGKFFFKRLTNYMSEGPLVALVLARPGAIRCWRRLMGPTNTTTARKEEPQSLRALYGEDGTRNATHGSDSTNSAMREIRFFFPEFRALPIPNSKEARDLLTKQQIGTRFVLGKGSLPDTLHSVLTRGLVELAKEKPSGLQAVDWLGRWLLDNNPRTGNPTRKVSINETLVEGTSFSKYVVQEPDESGQNETTTTTTRSIVVEEQTVVEEKQTTIPMNSDETTMNSTSRNKNENNLTVQSVNATTKNAIIFVLGAPGSGKGTQCARLAEKFGYAHISTGDLLRAEIKQETELGKEIEAITKAGQLVSTSIVLDLLRKAITTSNSNRFLIDGYPRTLEQAIDFETMIGRPSMVLEFTASKDELQQRIIARGETSGRVDDTKESLLKRFDTFEQESAPVIDFYRKLALVRTIQSERKTPDQVFEEAQKVLIPRIVSVLGGPGSGKTAISQYIHKQFGFQRLCVDDLIEKAASMGGVRFHIPSGSPPQTTLDTPHSNATDLDIKIAQLRLHHDIIPDEMVVQLLVRTMNRIDPLGQFILDNYPRTLDQAKQLDSSIGSPAFIVSVEGVSDKILRNRTIARLRRADDTKTKTNTKNKLSKKSKSKKSTTASANKHTRVNKASSDMDKYTRIAEKQLRIYHTSTQKLIHIYRRQGRVRTVCGNASNEHVQQKVAQYFIPKIIAVLGGPGSGKGTQCIRIQKQFNYVHLSTGDLLRAEVIRKSSDGAQIQSYMEQGKLVPTPLIVALLQHVMRTSGSNRFLIDGFPRAIDQATTLKETIGIPDAVLYFDCSIETMRDRLNHRDASKPQTENKESIEKQIQTFQEVTMPVIDYYGRLGKIINIDATPDPDTVFASIKTHVAPEYIMMIGGPKTGKQTHAKKIAQEFGYVHISLPDVVAAEIEHQSKYATLLLEAQRKEETPQDAGPSVNTNNDVQSEIKSTTEEENDNSEKVVSDETDKAEDKKEENATRDSIKNPSDTYEENQSMAQPNVDDSQQQSNVDNSQQQQKISEMNASSSSDISPYARYIPYQLTASLMAHAVVATQSDRVLISGFPRTREELETFEHMIGMPSMIVDLDASEQTLRSRCGLKKRKVVRVRQDNDEDEEEEEEEEEEMEEEEEDLEEEDAEGKAKRAARKLQIARYESRVMVYIEATKPMLQNLQQSNHQYKIAPISVEQPMELVISDIRRLFQAELVILIGASGSGRGEFCMRASRELGYTTLKVTHLLQAEAALGNDSPYASDIQLSFDTKRTAPLEATIAVIKKAIQSTCSHRFILDGFPRVVSIGYPSVQDMIFALEQYIGRVRGAILLDTNEEDRRARLHTTLTSGEERRLKMSLDAYEREKLPVTHFFEQVGKLRVINTAQTPEEVFEDARPFIE